MVHNAQPSKGSTSRRSFLRKGIAVGGAGAVGATLLAGGLPAFAKEESGGITTGDIAILRFLSAAEILETDLWQQYNELGASRIAKSLAEAGANPTSTHLRSLMVTCPSISTTILKMR